MKSFTIIILSTLIALPLVAVAQIPHTLSYQGILADTAGTPKPDGSYNFTFRLYPVSSGGTAIWSETKSAQVKHGLFSTILGSVTPIPDSVKFDRQYWLGVQVASDPELSPRMQLSSVGSSMNSLRADVAQTVPDGSIVGGKIASGQVVKSINNLHDNLTMRGANGASITTNGDTITVTASGGGGGGIGTIQNTDNALNVINPAGPTTTVNVRIPFTINGNMGVGTTTPQGLLDVNSGSGGSDVSALFVRADPGVFGRGGIIHHQSSTYAWQELAQTTSSATDGYLAFHYVNRATPGTKVTSNVLALRGNGNVGIGTTTPSSRLEIAAQDGLAITGYQPFLTLRDANAGVNTRGVIQSVDGGLNLFANSYLIGLNPTAFIHLDPSGNVGIGTPTPTSGKLQVENSAGNAIYASSSSNNAVYGTSGTGDGVAGINSGNTGIGVYGQSNSGFGMYALSSSGIAMYGSSSSSIGVNGSSGSNIGVKGESNGSDGVLGYSTGWIGVHGIGTGGFSTGVQGEGGLTGVSGRATGTGPSLVGVYGITTNPGFAGYFAGDVVVTGNLSKGGGSFKIDHPLDPANKYLYHSFVESPDMMDIYNGIVTLDTDGEATVVLPEWFDALNKDFRYQLTAIGAPGPNLYVAEEIADNQFRIAGGTSGKKVSWQVTGIRKDAYAQKHRIPVEEMKSERERGYYLHPEAFGQTQEKSIEWAIHPEMMKKHEEQPLRPPSIDPPKEK